MGSNIRITAYFKAGGRKQPVNVGSSSNGPTMQTSLHRPDIVKTTSGKKSATQRKGRSGNGSKDQCANDGCKATETSRWYYDKSPKVYVCLNCYNFLRNNNNHYPDYVSGKDKKGLRENQELRSRSLKHHKSWTQTGRA